jgi:hypothetical protein
VPPRTELARVLGPIAAELRRRRARWYLFGAQAVVLHGHVRHTADIDVTVEVDARSLSELVARLTRTTFELRIRGFEAEVAATRVVPLRHRATGVDVDLVLAGPGLEEELLTRVDLVRVRATLGALQQALGQSELVPAFERELADARALTPPRSRPSAAARGKRRKP